VVEKVDKPAVGGAGEKEKEVMVNFLKEEAHHALTCLMKNAWASTGLLARNVRPTPPQQEV